MSLVVVGQNWSGLAQECATFFNAPLLTFTQTHFADSESCVDFQHATNLSKATVILAFQFMPTDRSETNGSLNDQLAALLQITDLLKTMGCKKIILFTPYLPYSRQDKSEDKKLPGSVFMLGRCLKSLGIEQIITCELHAPAVIATFPLPLFSISLEHFWSAVVKQRILDSILPENLCIVSPDQGGKDRAMRLANLLGVSYACTKKIRSSHDVAAGYELEGCVRNMVVLLLDDIVNTGHTALSASELCLGRGAQSIFGAFTHALLSGDATTKLGRSRIEKIFITDTICDKSIHADNKIRPIAIHQFLFQELAKHLATQKIV